MTLIKIERRKLNTISLLGTNLRKARWISGKKSQIRRPEYNLKLMAASTFDGEPFQQKIKSAIFAMRQETAVWCAPKV